MKQYIETVTLVLEAKRLDRKLRVARRNVRVIAHLLDWINGELRRRASEAQRLVGAE